MIDDTLLKTIDDAHIIAKKAQQNKELDLYIDIFADDLQYKQLNGKTIGKKQLAADVKRYFNRVKSFSSNYRRTEFSFSEGKVTERLTQYSEVSIRVFIFFTKKWTVEREGIYEWKMIKDSWKIFNVEVLNERIY
ncbi:hypothetical protein SNE26_02140 [Mucilaginibacter sp. cycad4]|uniref:hypothetical protein n=1 Tax=Mucilaginibacter sp. cycad4 TaxID=3342096 RepID=UPI002AAB753E|nr:hypothetical protein [Mucilaginibacter gossypii]WPV00565.1 hypothetical protein SNE26_02140 [Mucilaginibacter gossypii]